MASVANVMRAGPALTAQCRSVFHRASMGFASIRMCVCVSQAGKDPSAMRACVTRAPMAFVQGPKLANASTDMKALIVTFQSVTHPA